MELILKENSVCADCEGGGIGWVNMQFGVFICDSCSNAHRHLKFPVRSVHSQFSDEDISMLETQGNKKMNASLMQYMPPWTATPREYNIDFVRLFFIENKYIHMTFANDLYQKYQSFDLNKYWFYLDESTYEVTKTKGPCTREQVIEMVDKGSLSNEHWIWHPVIGQQWLVMEKVIYILKPPDSLSDSALYETCHKKLALLELPYPQLRGYVNVTHNMRTLQKWLVILDKRLAVFTQNTSTSCEYEIPIDGLDVNLLQPGQDLCIELNDGPNEWFVSSTPPEIMEWFHAIRCVRYLMYNLAEDMPTPMFDPSESHICSVKSSKEYMGEKLMEGPLSKEGSIWKSKKTRWCVLRSIGFYYYVDKKDKVPLAEIRLYKDTQVGFENDTARFWVISRDKFVYLWASSEEERQEWLDKLNKAVEAIRQRVSNYTSLEFLRNP